MLTDDQKKMLTEEILGGCWHESKDGCAVGKVKPSGGISMQICYKCKAVMSDSYHIINENRSFTAWQDLGTLKGKIVESGKWYEFFNYARDSYVKTVRSEIGYADFVLWLFTPDRFCALVAEWWTERGM